MSSREGYDAYLLYLGIKLHFNTESYDFIKYNGKVDATIDAYLKRKDKFHFAKLSRKYKQELRDFFIANLSFKDYWAGDLLENEAHKRYTEWKKRQQSLFYNFESEVQSLLEKKSITEILTVKNGQHPHLLKQFLGKKISIETMCILEEITHYSKKWNTMISETIVYPNTINKINKYKSFVRYDFARYKQRLVELCSR